MIRIGQIVTVNNESSMTFSGMTGEVIDINPNSYLPIRVAFSELNEMAYWFTEDELDYEPMEETDEEEVDY
jgi:hypothetical protein